MHVAALSTLLATHDPVHMRRVRAAMQPAPHALAPAIRHAALTLAELDGLLDALDPRVLPSATQRMVRSRLRAFLAGRLCAEHALAQLGAQPEWIARDALGAPCWPTGFAGSIAHTSSLACAAVAPVDSTLGVGIDSERIADTDTVHHIRKACCTPRENELLFGAGDDEVIATVIFSVKESYYKAISARVGRVVEFDEVEVRHIDVREGRVSLTPVSSPLVGLVPPVQALLRICDGGVHTSVVLPPTES